MATDPEQEARSWAAANEAIWGRLRLDLIHERLLSAVGREPGRVLDVGAGTGETARLLAQRGHTVVALDTSDAMLAHLRAATRAGESAAVVETIQADLREVGRLGLGSFDLVLCHNVLAFVDDGQQALDGLSELLVPGGRISVVVNNRLGEPIRYALEHKDLVEALRWLEVEPHRRRSETFDHDLVLQDLDELQEWLEAAGLVPETRAGLNVIAPYLDNAFKEHHYSELVSLELLLGSRSPYREIAVHLHVIARKPGEEGSGSVEPARRPSQ